MEKYTLLIDKNLYEKLCQAAGEESIQRKKSVSWSKLARRVLNEYIEQQEKSQPTVPEKHR